LNVRDLEPSIPDGGTIPRMINKPTRFELMLQEFDSTWTCEKGKGRTDFVFNVRYTSVFLASDPCDKLFALLHICPDTSERVNGNKLLAPNYEKSIEEVILDCPRGGLHLSLAIKATKSLGKISPGMHDSWTPCFSNICGLRFWNTQFWKTLDRPRALFETRLYETEAYVVTPASIPGRNSTVVSS
jgi:hypothetical protein